MFSLTHCFKEGENITVALLRFEIPCERREKVSQLCLLKIQILYDMEEIRGNRALLRPVKGQPFPPEK